jgi:LacI family transcriptional regulator
MKAARKPTITDVARLAEVSVGTVSHVLNGTINVSVALRERVERAIAMLGYEQNMLAHAQRRQLAPVVGLSVPHVASAYLAALIDSFEDIAALRGYQMMQVLTRRDPQIELRRVRELLRHRIACCWCRRSIRTRPWISCTPPARPRCWSTGRARTTVSIKSPSTTAR